MKKWEVMKAYDEGAIIEVRDRRSNGNSWIVHGSPLWDWVVYEYRVKPKPELRPWKPEEFPPVGTLLRQERQTYPIIKMLIAKCEKLWVPHILKYIKFITPEEALADWSYSTDNEQTWHPCGIEEGE